MDLKICVYKPARGGQTEVEEKEALSSVILKPKSTPAYEQEQCTVCLDLQDDLRVLPCGHLMCYNCLVRWMKTKLEEGTEPTCHACRAIITTLEDIASQFPTDLEHGVQASADRLHRYCPADFNHKVEVGKTDPLFDTDIYKSRQRGSLSMELSKSANDKEYQQFIQVVQDWTAQRVSCVWMSDTLSADLNLPLNAKPPDCKLVQMFVLGEDLQAILLSVYDGSVGEGNEKSQESLKEEVLRFTAKTARVLSGCLHRYCYCDFIIIPCALPRSAFRDKDALCQEVETQKTFVRSYYGGPFTLTETANNKLRTATTTLSSTSFVPCFLLDGQNQDDRKEWMLSFDSDWRSVVSLFIESLTRENAVTEVTYDDETKEKLRVAAIEAAKRLSHQYKVQIVSNDVTVGKCVEKLQKQTKTEYDDGVTLNLDHVPLTDEESQPHKHSFTASQVLEGQRPQKRGRYSEPGIEERDSASSSAEGARGGPPPTTVKSQGEQSGLRFGKSECKDCQGLLETIGRKERHTVLSMTGILKQFSGTTKQTRMEGQKIEEFLANMNALMNEGGGELLIHVEDPYFIKQFDDQVGQKLMNLIADDSTYYDNFERFFMDESHLIFRVKARHRSFLSTLHFNTKLRTERGRCDPTHQQIRRFLSFSGDPEPPVVIPTDRFQFDKDQEPREIGGRVFVESLHIQAKSVMGFFQHKRQSTNKDTRFPEYIWSDLRLPLQISALSKVREGGRVYFGIKEIKAEVTDPQTGKRYEISSGKYLCEGTVLDNIQQENMRRAIQEKVRKEMLWVGLSRPDHPVDIKFHPVKNGEPDLVVVEVFVRYFHGVAFYDREGPEAYTIAPHGHDIHRISLKQWLAKHNSSFVPQEPVFT